MHLFVGTWSYKERDEETDLNKRMEHTARQWRHRFTQLRPAKIELMAKNSHERIGNLQVNGWTGGCGDYGKKDELLVAGQWNDGLPSPNRGSNTSFVRVFEREEYQRDRKIWKQGIHTEWSPSSTCFPFRFSPVPTFSFLSFALSAAFTLPPITANIQTSGQDLRTH